MKLSQLHPFSGPVLVLFLLWADLVWVVHREWIYNEQYSYGWLTLFLLIYLLYVRISDRPAGTPSRFTISWFLVLGILLLTANRIILESNPEWRLAIWTQALLVYGMTLLLLWKLGGRTWLRHFAPVFALMLFAVPWPTFVENPVTGGLMRAVAGIVVEGMNFLGFYAERSGNLIRLREGWVGIDVACSGVRNLQSTLMSAWFVGELFRFVATGRLLLLVLSGCASLVINVGRTTILTWTTHRSGSDLTESIHDPVGHLVSLIAFVFLLIVAFFLRRYFSRPPVKPEDLNSGTSTFSGAVESNLRQTGWFFAIVFLVAGYGLTELWFLRSERSLPAPQVVEIDWSNFPVDVEFVEIASAIRGQLKYDVGVQAEWVDPNEEIEWQVFSFSWTEGSVSPFVGVHRPEACMPASGFRMTADHPPLTIGLGDREFEFEVNTFHFLDQPYQVYYATWTDFLGSELPVVRTARDRLRFAWEGRRVTNRRSLQIVIEGLESESFARRKVVEFLGKTLKWGSSSETS
ncbi:MAG: exosortase/archaeosortase family protein [Verrucomicrobiota bacterium]